MGLQEELDEARATLLSTQASLHASQSCLLDNQAHSSQVIMKLNQQLYVSRTALRQQKTKADRQLNEVMSHLLFLEGRLRKEKVRLSTEMSERAKLIQDQQSQIQQLKQQNDQLLNAIKEFCARGGINGLMRNNKNGTSSSKDKGQQQQQQQQQQKGRLGSVKDKFWKNRSSLELNTSDLDRAFQLESTRMYSSHEDLHSAGNDSILKSDKNLKDSNRSVSPGHMVNGSSKDSGISLSPGDSGNNMNGHSVTFNDDVTEVTDTGEMFVFSTSHINSVIDEEDSGFRPINKSLLSLGSLPMLSNTDPGHMRYSAKTRPHSLSSVDLNSIQQEALGNAEFYLSNSPTPPSSPSIISGKSDSTPFQAFKTMFRRKGSKMKSKKRPVSLSQCTSQEYTDAMKKHFQKYDMN